MDAQEGRLHTVVGEITSLGYAKTLRRLVRTSPLVPSERLTEIGV